jgi:hypothetical protein
VAQLAVPCSEPVILGAFREPVMVIPLPLTNKLPVIIALPEYGNPAPLPPLPTNCQPAFVVYDAVSVNT